MKRYALWLLILALLLSACTANPSPAQGTTAAAPSDTAASALPSGTDQPGPEGAAAPDYQYSVTPEGIILTAYTGEEAEPQIPAELEGTPVIEIGDGCFQGRICLERVQIPEGVARIGDYAFECCGNQKKLYLPRSLRSIGAGAFSGCCNLSLADFQEGLESVGKGAFLYCKSLVYAELPHSLTSLGAFAFAGCDELAKVVFLGDEIKELPDRL